MNATLRRAVKLFGKRAVLLNLVVGWTVFWSIVVRLHLRLGDTVGATTTGAVGAVPIVGLLVWMGYHGVRDGVGIGWLRELLSTHETNTPS